MPKIKLSALVSDMKGKSQGSVFSSNSGGTYFRNNKTGGGKKSAAWDKQKNNLASLSSSWKGLTSEQQDAWNTMCSSYQTINAFGDPRIPSGYELFMRLNGTLQGIDQPLLNTPVSPRVMPSLSDAIFQIPDFYLYQPSKSFNPNYSSSVPLRLYSETFVESYGMDGTQMLMISGVLTLEQYNRMNNNTYYSFCKSTDSNGDGLRFFLKKGASGTLLIYVMMQLQDNALSNYCRLQVFTVNFDQIKGRFSIGFQYVIKYTQLTSIYVNGINITADSTALYSGFFFAPSDIAPGEPPVEPPAIWKAYSSVDMNLMLGSFVDSCPAICSYIDLRVYTIDEIGASCLIDGDCLDLFSCSSLQCSTSFTRLIDGTVHTNVYQDIYYAGLGYIIGSELLVYAFGEYVNNKCVKYGTGFTAGDISIITEPECSDDSGCSELGSGSNDVECIGGVCVYVGDGAPMLENYAETVAPSILFGNMPSGHSGFSLVLETTGPISGGKSIEQVRYKKFATVDLSDSNYDVSTEFKNLVGSMPHESSVAFKIFLVDKTTGQRFTTDVPTKKPRRNKVKFKAGAELSGKVN